MTFFVQQTTLKRILGLYSKTCPEMVMNINNKLMVQFIFKHLGIDADPDIDQYITKNSNLLEEGFVSSDDVPTTDW